MVLGRILAQLFATAIPTLMRAIPAAYQQALNNARKTGIDHEVASTALRRTIRNAMDKDQALQILNIEESQVTAEIIQKQYDRYMEANDTSKGSSGGGGSFYLQSKVYRAKELLDEYIKEKQQEKEEERGGKQ